MIINRSAYSNGKVQVLYQYLKNADEKGRAIEYEIKVDDLRVVGRTSEIDDFDGYEEFVTEDTRTVTFIFFEGQSRRSTRHVLELNAGKKEEIKESRELKEIRQLKEQLAALQLNQGKAENLSGQENNFDEKLKNFRRDWDFDELKKKYTELEKELTESQKAYEQLDKENDALIENIREVKKQLESEQDSSSMKQLVPKLMDDLLKGKNDSVLLSGLTAITGTGSKTENKKTLSGTEASAKKEEATVSFKKKEPERAEASFSEMPPSGSNASPAPVQNAVSESPQQNQEKVADEFSPEEKEIMLSIKQTMINCNDEQVGDMVDLLGYVSEDPSQIKKILQQIKGENESKSDSPPANM